MIKKKTFHESLERWWKSPWKPVSEVRVYEDHSSWEKQIQKARRKSFIPQTVLGGALCPSSLEGKKEQNCNLVLPTHSRGLHSHEILTSLMWQVIISPFIAMHSLGWLHTQAVEFPNGNRFHLKGIWLFPRSLESSGHSRMKPKWPLLNLPFFCLVPWGTWSKTTVCNVATSVNC